MNTKIILALFLITLMFVDTGCSHHRPVARRPAVIVVAQTPFIFDGNQTHSPIIQHPVD